jgi:hypothetical protein
MQSHAEKFIGSILGHHEYSALHCPSNKTLVVLTALICRCCSSLFQHLVHLQCRVRKIICCANKGFMATVLCFISYSGMFHIRPYCTLRYFSFLSLPLSHLI